MVQRYDAREPRSLEMYCDFLGVGKQQFYAMVDPMRDPAIWERIDGQWQPKDAVFRQAIAEANERQRVLQSADRALSGANRHLYYNPHNPPAATGDAVLDVYSSRFRIL